MEVQTIVYKNGNVKFHRNWRSSSLTRLMSVAMHSHNNRIERSMFILKHKTDRLLYIYIPITYCLNLKLHMQSQNHRLFMIIAVHL